jgi:NADP-dependent 3-hydroxy acid dehydrogenase YdfG
VRDKKAVLMLLIPYRSLFKIDVLINNAGNAHGLDLYKLAIYDWDAMIDINVRNPICFRSYNSSNDRRKSGHIINIGSTAAKEVYPNGNVYCASKHAVDALNQGMRMDLNPYGL